MFRIDKKIGFFFLMGTVLLFSGCGSDRAGEIAEKQVAGVVERDSDGDGVIDSDEINIYFTDPLVKDSDGDGLDDKYEIDNGLNPNIADTDGDGLNDGDEVNTHHTDPKNRDSDGDGLDDKYEINNGLNPNLTDTDGDGLNDGDEVNMHHTDPKNRDSDGDGLEDKYEIDNGLNPNLTDTDGDGLNDGDEVNTHHTDPKNRDSDGDGLEDGDEINTYETNASNPDTDGDCLFDNHELLNYGTDPKKSDSDGDGVEDGFEIYGDLNATCAVISVLNATPAQDNMPVDGDVMDALDPSNDSDGDGWANLQELNCTGGDPKDRTETCPAIDSTPEGEALASYGYIFIPGAFDVDGDGVDEGGFWAATYQATAVGIKILNTEVKSTMGTNFNAFVADNFSLLNSSSQIEGFFEGEFPLNDDAEQLTFKEGEILDATTKVRKSSMPRYVGMTPYMAMVSIKHVKFRDTDSKDLGVAIDMLSNKQYTHIQQLLTKDKEVNGENNDAYVPTVRNGLLGVDIHVPIVNYEIKMKEFGKDYLEFVSDALHMYSADGVVFNEATDIEPWWGIEEKDFPTTGTNSRDELRDIDGDGTIEGIVSGDGGYYAIMARGGLLLNLKEGVIGGKKIATGEGIGFRAATPYLY